jgi:membrane protease YdiL (CAAX protease family)
MVHSHKKLIWLYPIVIIICGFTVSFVFKFFINEWAFIPLALFYWSAILLITKPTMGGIKILFSISKNKIRYSLLAFMPVLFCIVAFVWGIQYIQGIILIILWIIFAVVNSFCEELFWRVFLFDNLGWKPLYSIIYSTLLFSLSHPLLWGVFSVTNRSSIMIFPLLVMGIIWGFIYWKTKSLRYIVLAHFLVDVLNLSVWVFLNIYVPPVV